MKRATEGTIAGRVTERTCSEGSCTSTALAGVTVAATGPEDGSDTTDADGRFSIRVDSGSYRVTPTFEDRDFEPASPRVTVEPGATTRADFSTCTIPEPGQTAAGIPATCEPLHIDWTMPPHLRAEGWDESQPSDGYVNPKGGWRVDLFLKDAEGSPVACASGRSWTWRIAPRGTDQAEVLRDRSCRLSTKVPREGVYSVSVEERRQSDRRLMAKGKQEVVVQDFLLVGMGDSNASGQANPPFWDRQCDRSEESYQMRVAQFVESRDDRSSVTFLHLACSGARTVHIGDESYVGQEPDQGSPLPPQAGQLRRVLRVGSPVREIDALILSVGINDLRFGGIVAACLENATDRVGDALCQDRFVRRVDDEYGEPTLRFATGSSLGDGPMRKVIQEETEQLPERYGAMAEAIAKRVTVRSERVLMTTYPDESWRSAGVLCDETSGYRPRLRSEEWGWLSESAADLNAAVAAAPYNEVTTIPPLFIGHGYCTPVGDNWFRSVLRSFQSQGNRYGTFHAIRPGHIAMADAVTEVLCPQLFSGSATCRGMAREPGRGSLP